MTEYLLKSHPSVFEITTATKFDLHDVDGKISYKIINTNELLKDSSDLTRRIIGGKTGETRTAGECLLLVIKSLDNQGYLINVILNSNDRFEKMKKIISWADENYNKK
jgi:D-alanyl-D-alanine carboxypeptidase